MEFIKQSERKIFANYWKFDVICQMIKALFSLALGLSCPFVISIQRLPKKNICGSLWNLQNNN